MAVKQGQVSSDASGRTAVEGYKINPSPMIRPYTQEQIDAVVRVMSKVQPQTQGPVMREFEAKFKQYIDSNHAFAVDNATNALRLAAIMCRLKPGDEVIIPAYTFCATAIPFGKTGAKIVWADIDPVTWVPAMGNVDVDPEMEIWPNNFCIGEAACACGIEALKVLDKTMTFS